MTDSSPRDTLLNPDKESILGELLDLRDRLLQLKQDRSTYIRSCDVMQLYDKVVERAHVLNNNCEGHQRTLEINRGFSLS